MPFFGKKGTILVPLGHQNEVAPPDKRALFSKSVPHGHHFIQNGALSIKRALFWCHWGTIFPQKRLPKGTKIVPLCKRAPFPALFWKMVPFFSKGQYFSALLALFVYRKINVWENIALSESGTKTLPQKVPFYGQSNGAQGAPFWCHLFF